jgi:hypothetical protein
MRPSPKKDPQRSEVYAWERKLWSIWKNHGMRMEDARSLVAKMCRYYRIPAPALKMTEDATWMGAAWGDSLIEVNKRVAKPTGLMLAHEVAHVIQHAYGLKEANHGPLWLGIYMELLDKFMILPRCMTEPSARRARLKFKRSGILPGEL